MNGDLAGEHGSMNTMTGYSIYVRKHSLLLTFVTVISYVRNKYVLGTRFCFFESSPMSGHGTKGGYTNVIRNLTLIHTYIRKK